MAFKITAKEKKMILARRKVEAGKQNFITHIGPGVKFIPSKKNIIGGMLPEALDELTSPSYDLFSLDLSEFSGSVRKEIKRLQKVIKKYGTLWVINLTDDSIWLVNAKPKIITKGLQYEDNGKGLIADIKKPGVYFFQD